MLRILFLKLTIFSIPVVLVLSFSAMAKAKTSKTSYKEDGKYVLAYNQLMVLTPKMRNNYLVKLRNLYISMDRTLKKKGKKQAFLLESLFFSEVNAANISNAKICMNLGWMMQAQGCNPNFDITSELTDPYKGTSWEAMLGSCEGETVICNPAVFGPGICGSNNNTKSCQTAANSAGDDRGPKALNILLSKCSGKNIEKKNATLCAALADGHNNSADLFSSVCHKKIGRRDYKTICDRGRKAYREVDKQYFDYHVANKTNKEKVRLFLPEAATKAHCQIRGTAIKIAPPCLSGGGRHSKIDQKNSICLVSLANCPLAPGNYMNKLGVEQKIANNVSDSVVFCDATEDSCSDINPIDCLNDFTASKKKPIVKEKKEGKQETTSEP